MARPRRVSDEQILETARRCFIERGANTPIAVVAERLGVSQPALFKRFLTRENLLLAALSHDPLGASLPGIARGPDDRDLGVQLEEIARELGAYLRAIVAPVAVLRAAGATFPANEPCPLVRARDAVASWIVEAQRQGRAGPCDPEALATMFVGALQMPAFMSYVNQQEVAPDGVASYVEGVADVLLAQLRAGAGADRAPASSVVATAS